MRRFFFYILILITLLSCHNAQSSQKDIIRLTAVTPVINFPHETAENLGIFDTYGIELNVINTGSGSESLDLLIEGDTDIAITAGSEFVEKIIQGNELIYISSFAGSYNGFQLITRHKDFDIADIHGQRVAIVRGTVLEYLLDYILVYYNIPIEAVERVHTDYTDMEDALKNEAVDSVLVLEPYASSILQNENFKSIELDGSFWLQAGYVVNRHFYNTNKDLLIRFLKAIHESLELINSDTYASNVGVSKDDVRLRNTLLKSVVYELSLDDLVLLNLESFARWYLRGRDEEFPDMERYLGNDILDQVLSQ